MTATKVFNWNKCFNDSKELVKKRTRYGLRRRANPYTKLETTKTNKRGSKLTKNRQCSGKLKRFPSGRKLSARKSTPKKSDEWQQEYDIWNMLTQSLDQHLLTNHKIVWENKEIGVRDSTGGIRLIQNRQQLNQMVLINSDGKRTHAKDLVNPNESDVALRVKFRLVPAMQGFTVLDNVDKKSYLFAGDDNEVNNNDIEYENKQTDQDIESDLERTLTSDTEFYPSYEGLEDDTCDETITNVTVVGDYSDFVDGLLDRFGASSTLIADKENIPVFLSPKKQGSRSITFADSPMPEFAKKRNFLTSWLEGGDLDAYDVLDICKSLKKLNSNIRRALFKIENVCARLIENVSSSMSISGVNFLSESIQI